MFLIGFTGYSGGGKTTLAEAVVRELCSRGYSVSCVKDAHHRIDLDCPGKDTHRYRTAGAAQVILRTPERWALMEETPEGRKSLEDILGTVRGVDFLVLEGFKSEGGFPQIEVRFEADERPFLWEKKRDIVALAAGEEAAPANPPPGIAILGINRPKKIADFVVNLQKLSGSAEK